MTIILNLHERKLLRPVIYQKNLITTKRKREKGIEVIKNNVFRKNVVHFELIFFLAAIVFSQYSDKVTSKDQI